MRILGDIPHAKYKITILEMNARLSIQIEDGDLVQTYKFRDGSLVTNVASANNFFDEEFLAIITSLFDQMRQASHGSLQRQMDKIEDEFDVII